MNPVAYHIGINGQQYRFQMDFDPEFPPDRTLHTQFKEGQIPEREVLSLMFLALKPGDVAFDIGANVGLFSLFMSQLVAPHGNVLAFEPSRLNFEKLKTNIALNKADVNLHPWALSDHQRELEVGFYEWEDSGQSSLRPATASTEASYKVTRVCLDDLIEWNPRLIKIDCEGAEEKILRGGERMLSLGVPFVICEIADQNLNRFMSDQYTLRDYMHKLGYSCWLPRPDGLLPTYIPYGTTFRSEVLNLNVLFATEQTVMEMWPVVEIKAG